MRKKRTKDRRTEKTEVALRGALAALMGEKPYEDIAVKEILGRANVGRSTFYTHFCDKDELLLSCIHDVLRSPPARSEPSAATPHERMLWFSLPIFEHIERHRHSGQGSLGPRARQPMHEHLQPAISELIEDEVETALRRRGRPVVHASPDLLVRWIASTFVLVLNWWVETDSPLAARDADRLFRGLIEPSLARISGYDSAPVLPHLSQKEAPSALHARPAQTQRVPHD